MTPSAIWRKLFDVRKDEYSRTLFMSLYLLCVMVAYYILKTAIIAAQGDDTTLADALGRDMKGKISPAVYLVAVPLAFVNHWVALGLYVVVALMWLVPDRRIESRIQPR